MKKKRVEPRLTLFSPNLKLEKNSWIQKFRDHNPLNIIIYFKALEYFFVQAANESVVILLEMWMNLFSNGRLAHSRN